MADKLQSLEYEVVQGKIEDSEVLATEVRFYNDPESRTYTFDSPVNEEDIVEWVGAELIKDWVKRNIEPEYDYTEPTLNPDTVPTQALLVLGEMCPCTTSQFSERFDDEYASTRPSKLKNRGYLTAIGKVAGKNVWSLTPKGVKEILCLQGHPTNESQLLSDTNNTGLDVLFNDDEDDTRDLGELYSEGEVAQDEQDQAQEDEDQETSVEDDEIVL